METIRYTFYDGGTAYRRLYEVGDWLADLLGDNTHAGGYDSFEECELDNQLFADVKMFIDADSLVRNFDKYTGPGYEIWHIVHRPIDKSKWQWDLVFKIEDPMIAVQCKLAA